MQTAHYQVKVAPNRMNSIFKSLVLGILLTLPAIAWADDPKFEHWPMDLKINGKIVVAGSLSDFGLIKTALPKLQQKQKTAILTGNSTDQETQNSLRSIFDDDQNVEILKVDGTTKQFRSILRTSKCVLWHGEIHSAHR